MLSLLRSQKNHPHQYYAIYDQPYNDQWTDEELLSHIIELDCSWSGINYLPFLPQCVKLSCQGNSLAELPELPKCVELICYRNQLKYLPDLANCLELVCSDNQLISLPKLSQCIYLDCSHNQLTSLPELNQCQYLYCRNNKLTNIPELPYGSTLDCFNNPLLLFNLKSYRKLWHFKHFYLALKYLRLWYKGMLHIKSKKKEELHIELQYSPKLPFYKNHQFYFHFKDLQKALTNN